MIPQPGTPSKPQSYHHAHGPLRTRSVDKTNNGGNGSPSIWKVLNFILCGFALGAATTAMFHSVNMPSISVQLEYADSPHHFRVKNAQVSTTNLFNPVSLVNDRSTDDETDDGVNQEDDDEVKKERSAIQKELKEADIPNDNRFVEEAAKTGNATSKDDKKYADQESEYQPSADEPDFSNPGLPPKLNPGEAFASCILIKDDNHWLIEWLAYHWHVMPLRYLIVAVDPDSKTSPIPILKRWKDRGLMTISIWGDEMFMPKTIKANLKMFDNNTELMNHRVRQNNFYFKCMRTFKQRNREWLMLTDTDEFIVPNYASGLYYNLTKSTPITKPGSALTLFKHHHQLTGENYTCSYMPRYMFGNKESEPSIVQRHVAKDGFNGRDFLTQRFIYRNARRMHNGKNLINLQKIPKIKTYTSVHHVSSYCPDPDKMRTVNHVKKSLVRVHHYLGTEEQYFFRSDPRQKTANVTKAPVKGMTNQAYFKRDKGRYNMLAKRANYPDQGARAWIRGFINSVGVETAKALLEGVGQVGYEGSDTAKE